MNDTHGNPPQHTPPHTSPTPFWRTRYGAGFLVFGAIAAYFLLTEHLAHVVGLLPLLLLLACPLMHVFMHHGHGSHHHGDLPPPPDAGKPNPSQGGGAS
ncbi:DUF2933 domain-containing protein [Polaromonas sp. JS666]|uniref:DUF2933 domain-containing protein n=1 Tax=Polaromonas sp. (strain JS666 / ATCC BAA-500) TaxID=296591 RepID=UPI0008834F21|nr:DUF2933 domain-containing protein [Polaromonas sp. JS666]SDM45384.1 Protein of unknown function [Polaromonas sp. JS666]